VTTTQRLLIGTIITFIALALAMLHGRIRRVERQQEQKQRLRPVAAYVVAPDADSLLPDWNQGGE